MKPCFEVVYVLHYCMFYITAWKIDSSLSQYQWDIDFLGKYAWAGIYYSVACLSFSKSRIGSS